MRLLKTHPILGLVNSYMVDSPQPANLSYMWNFGSLLGMVLIIQIITGVTLAMHYTPSVDLAFVSVEHIMRDVNYGWLLRYLHANGASFFFIFVYLHIGRGLYYGSYRSPRTLPWSIGVIILVLMMATAFLGYVLPYGQMSLWGIQWICLTCAIWLSVFIMTSYDFITVHLSKGVPAHKKATRIRGECRIGPHHCDILSIFYGSLLGDSHAERRESGKGTRLSFIQESNRSDYLFWLHSMIAQLGYCNPTVPKLQSRLGSNGKTRFVLRFHSFTYTSLNTLHEAWYSTQDGKKRVPSDIGEYLSPLALAIWIMDDGSRAGYGLKFSTNSFTFIDCTFLVSVLHKNFGLKASVQSAGIPNQHVIYIWSESIPLLRQLVQPFIVSSMLYKLGE